MRTAIFALLVAFAGGAVAQNYGSMVAPIAPSTKGRATTDSTGRISPTFPNLPATASVVMSAENATTVNCLLTPGTVSASGFTANCSTITYGALGGQAQRTAAPGVVVNWIAM